MSASKHDIACWLKNADKKTQSHMIVVIDTYNFEDYPVYVLRTEEINKVINQQRAKPMTRVVEVYNLDMSIEEQLKAVRAFNL